MRRKRRRHPRDEGEAVNHKDIDEAGERAAKKMKILLQHKVLELLLHDMVAVQGLGQTRDVLKWWHERLDEF
jgi:hypothetical protein